MSNHPTGVAGVLSALLVLGLSALGVDISEELAVTLMGAVVAAVSAFSPRVTDIYEIKFTPEQVDAVFGKDEK
jgi:hypothetical protein